MTETLSLNEKDRLQTVWRNLVDPQTIYDELSFRLNFFDPTNNDLHCLVNNQESVKALLPLQKEKATGEVRFIGSPFLERNRGYCATGSEDELIKLYQKAGLMNSDLDDISIEDPITKTNFVDVSDDSFVYNFSKNKVISTESLFNTFSSRLRERGENAKSYLNKEVVITENTLHETVAELKKISYERFKEDSWLENNIINEGALKLAELDTKYPMKIHSRLLKNSKGECLGAHIGATHKKTYYSLFSGAQYQTELPEIGTLVHLISFDLATTYQCDFLDTGLGDCGWKSRWGLDPIKQYKFIN